MSAFDTAKLIAQLLESDLVAAAQLKEHIKPERLLEITGIQAPEAEVLEGNLTKFTNDEIASELSRRLAK